MDDLDRREGYCGEPIDPDELQYRVSFAFTQTVRNLIRKRAGGRSELSGRRDRPMECSHNNHNKHTGHYNTPENGMYVTDTEHAAFHIWSKQKGHNSGLTEEQNNWSIGEIIRRVFRHDEACGMDPIESCEDIERSINLWQMFWDMLTNRVETTETHLQDRD